MDRLSETVLETKRLLLEPLDERYRDDFAALAADHRVMRYIGSGNPWDRQRADDVFTRHLDHWKEHAFGWRSAIEKPSGSWIGFIALNYVGPEAVEIPDEEVEIGWWLEPSFWGRGLATEGALALRDEGFDRLSLERVIGRYQPANIASGRIMERLGLRFEREAIGSHGDTVRIYALHRSEWLSCRHRVPEHRRHPQNLSFFRC